MASMGAGPVEWVTNTTGSTYNKMRKGGCEYTGCGLWVLLAIFTAMCLGALSERVVARGNATQGNRYLKALRQAHTVYKAVVQAQVIIHVDLEAYYISQH